MKVHQGLTTCRICGKVLSIVAHLRSHMVQVHKLGPEQVRQLVPTAAKGRPYTEEQILAARRALVASGAGQGESLQPAQDESREERRIF